LNAFSLTSYLVARIGLSAVQVYRTRQQILRDCFQVWTRLCVWRHYLMPTVALKRALATYRAHTAVYRHVRLLFLVRLESYLNAAGLSGALHSGGDVNGVAPNIIVWFSGSDDSGSYRAVINPCIQEQQPYLLHQHRFINACPLVSSNIDHCFYDK